MPTIKARYRVTGPKKENVAVNVASIDSETKSLMQETVVKEFDTYMIYFPQGHSIRVLGFDKLKEMGYHIKPRMVDMETGDVIDAGGDPYDFANAIVDDTTSLVDDDDVEELQPGKRVRGAAATS